MVKLPGLIDSHVHLREPGATQKEDFETGTKAAIAGGYTLVLDMPNNPEPTVTPESVDKKIQLAKGRIYTDLGFHFGASAESAKYFNRVRNKVFGLKVYMNHTTGTLLQEDPKILQAIFEAWPKDKVLMVHAEGKTLEIAIQLARKNGNKLHVCHVSVTNQINLIRQAKQNGLSITCEVTCHHLFLTQDDLKKLGPYGIMRPPLTTKEDQEALWTGIQDGIVDTIASDHAPHTKEEKNSPNPPNGVPGLETTLPLLLTAVNDGKLTIDNLIRLCHTNPKRIFDIPDQPETFVEVDPIPYTLNPKPLYTKCGWTPFDGWKVKGRVKKVVLRGKIVYDNGQFVGVPQGKVIMP
ncbi:MAG: amidohydrolase family protein [Patescibacteria group bacterium]